MRKNQITKEIDERFQTEENKVVDNTEQDSKKEKIFRITLAFIMSAVVIGSLAYSLITAILQ